jgi:hypothetical protein
MVKEKNKPKHPSTRLHTAVVKEKAGAHDTEVHVYERVGTASVQVGAAIPASGHAGNAGGVRRHPHAHVGHVGLGERLVCDAARHCAT